MELREAYDEENEGEHKVVRKPEPEILERRHDYEDKKDKRAILLAARREIEEKYKKQIPPRTRSIVRQVRIHAGGHRRTNGNSPAPESTESVHVAATGGTTKDMRS